MPKGSFGYGVDGQQVDNTSSATYLWALILGALQNLIGIGAPGSNSGITQQSVTQNFAAVAASSSQSIPIGAKEWTAGVLTGTGTIGGVAVAAGFTDGSDKPITAAITVTTDSASTAYVRWAT